MRQEGEGRGSREAGRAQNTKGLARLPWVSDFVQGSWRPLGAASRRVRWGRAFICWAALQSTDLRRASLLPSLETFSPSRGESGEVLLTSSG